MKLIILLVSLTLVSNIYAEDKKEILSKIKKFGKALKIELKKGMKKSPAEAINICNVKAPEIVHNLATTTAKIGRVSLKNRNKNNYPKDWMMKYIDGFNKKEITKPYIVTDLKNGKKGLLKPIITMPLCLKCHGTNIKNDLKEKISKIYPADKAIGYKTGQIRGFFWAEY